MTEDTNRPILTLFSSTRRRVIAGVAALVLLLVIVLGPYQAANNGAKAVAGNQSNSVILHRILEAQHSIDKTVTSTSRTLKLVQGLASYVASVQAQMAAASKAGDDPVKTIETGLHNISLCLTSRGSDCPPVPAPA